ncbi:MAG: ligase-associated DNA damage response exonuclease [Proteobacteria bacterium]|nr:ligase-associated DNA damage response exonuclease [Pseudomonadota bacterium]
MPRTPVLSFTDRGLYCAAGNFYVDPWKPVDRALITHGHSDHARPDHRRYMGVASGAAVLRLRLGEIALQTVSYGETLRIGDATVSFHPAGHVPGSAQIRVEVAGEVWVVSGDYKTEADGLSEPFEPVACHTFISECTFGLPVFRWAPQAEVMADINHWWRTNRDEGRVSVIGAYALGKAQRILAHLDPAIGPVLTHGAVENVNGALRASGFALPPTTLVTPETTAAVAKGAIILAPPSALGSPWARRFGPVAEAFASGWMRLRGVRRRRGLGKGFILSDHADWDGLNAAIAATGAERVFVTHGYTQPFRRWLADQGYDAGIVETGFGGDEEAEA